MEEIDLITGAGTSGEEGAFDPRKIEAVGLDNMALSQALAQALRPFAPLLRQGCGFGVIDREDDVSVIGIKASDE